MAHPTRFERVTSAFGGQHSIQLSYGCVIVANTRNTVRITDFADKAKKKAVSLRNESRVWRPRSGATWEEGERLSLSVVSRERFPGEHRAVSRLNASTGGVAM